MSDLPKQDNINFLFKINSQAQDRLFKGFPVLGFGVYRSNSYLTASYKAHPVMLNLGANLSNSQKPIFFGGSLQISQAFLLQLDSNGEDYGIGLRGQLQRFQLSLIIDNNIHQEIFDASLYWGVAFIF